MKLKKVTLNRNGQTHAKVRETSADLERRMRRLGLTPGAMAKEGK